MPEDRRWGRDWDRRVPEGRAPEWRDRERRGPNGDEFRARQHDDGRDGRGFGGLNEWSYRDRGPGRMFDRGEDYGRADAPRDVGRAGDGARARDEPRRAPEEWRRWPDRRR